MGRPAGDPSTGPHGGRGQRLDERASAATSRPEPVGNLTTADVTVSWIAALALGLAHSEGARGERLWRLAQAADGETELLARAADRISAAAVSDPQLERRAVELLALTTALLV